MAQHRFAVPSTHMRIWFANRLRAVRELFGELVYTRLYKQENECFNQTMLHCKILCEIKSKVEPIILLKEAFQILVVPIVEITWVAGTAKQIP